MHIIFYICIYLISRYNEKTTPILYFIKSSLAPEEDLPIADPCSNDPLQIIDTDGDGFYDNVDAFPFNGVEWADSNGDGVGDNQDPFL